jgi:cytochrome c
MAPTLSGSFDTWRSAGRFCTVREVLRLHEGAVNAVAILQDGRAVTAGEDARIAIWAPSKQEPEAILEGHNGPIAALAVSPDGRMLASASWDRTIRLWPLAGGAPRVLEGHRQNVNAVAFSPNRKTLLSAGYDATVRFWPLQQSDSPQVAALPSPLNALVVAPDGEIVTAGADGKVYFLSPAGETRSAVDTSPTPITALAISRNGERIATASIDGSVAIIDREIRTVARALMGVGLPVWSVAFLADDRTLLTGCADRMIRRWDVETGSRSATARSAVPGIRSPTMRAIRARRCFALASPAIRWNLMRASAPARITASLDVVLRRCRATLFQALKRLDIVWTPETVTKLFEIGPRATRRAPRCRSNGSAPQKTATPSSGFSNGQRGNQRSGFRSRSRR